MAITAGNVMDRAAAAVNDPNRNTYSYTVQLPYLKMAYEHFEGKLILNDIPILQEISATITYTANATTITAPTDMFLPVNLYERDTGSTDDDSWIKITETPWDQVRNASSQNNIGVWTWREGALVVGKTNRNRDVLVRYIKDTTGAISSDATTIAIGRATNCLAFKTAEFLAKYIMNNPTRAQFLAADAQEAYDDWLSAAVKKNQSKIVRRKGYSYGRKAPRPYIT